MWPRPASRRCACHCCTARPNVASPFRVSQFGKKSSRVPQHVLRSTCVCFKVAVAIPQPTHEHLLLLGRAARGVILLVVVTRWSIERVQEAGACAVMALERVPADIRKDGGVARMSDPGMIKEIKVGPCVAPLHLQRPCHQCNA
jgi:hypothetical protein